MISSSILHINRIKPCDLIHYTYFSRFIKWKCIKMQKKAIAI
jgi:hypothetical protein